ncbi:hypothetical protein BCR39DRAFT_269336 [Naematelia encephala]|uniref:Uncharacterized protein n=1 Tax=Naematelia encephala TaxID=71784 RepID=A0A1Y2AV85_9TREE|nr:hypothetical protein BCR39DRAFT_269336 [Naematelia encephala]
MDIPFMQVGGGGALALPTPRRSLPVQQRSPPPVQRPSPPQPVAGPSRLSLHQRRPIPKVQSFQNPTQDNTLPLQQEIDRLTAACEEHERKIRSIRGSIEHRLFVELPALLGRLLERDDDAEVCASTVPPMRQKLSEIVAARTKDLETMRERTAPWQTLFAEADKGGILEGDGKTGHIERVPGIGKDGSDGLARIEWWADETEMLLNAEIIRLKAEVASKSTTSRRIWGTVVGSLSTVFLVIMVLVILAQFR